MKKFNWFNSLLNGSCKIWSIKNEHVVTIINIETNELVVLNSKAINKINWVLKNKKSQNLFYRG